MHVYSKLCKSSCQTGIYLISEIMSFLYQCFLPSLVSKPQHQNTHIVEFYLFFICWRPFYFSLWWTTPNFNLLLRAIFPIQVICLWKTVYFYFMLTIPVISAFLYMDVFKHKINNLLFCIPEPEYFFPQSLLLSQPFQSTFWK